MIVDEAVDPVRDIGIWEEESAEVEEEEDLCSGRESARRLVPSWTYEGLLAFTMFPSASLQSLFLVASIPSPSPPASSSFSLWRAMCRSLGYVRPRWVDHCSETYRAGHGGGNGHCSADRCCYRPCGSTRDGEGARSGKRTFRSLDGCSQTFS